MRNLITYLAALLAAATTVVTALPTDSADIQNDTLQAPERIVAKDVLEPRVSFDTYLLGKYGGVGFVCVGKKQNTYNIGVPGQCQAFGASERTIKVTQENALLGIGCHLYTYKDALCTQGKARVPAKKCTISQYLYYNVLCDEI